MTGKERIKAVLAHKIPDMVPIAEQLIVSKVAKELLGRHAYTGGGEYNNDEIKMLKGGQREFLVSKFTQDVLELYHTKLDLDAIPVGFVPHKDEKLPLVMETEAFTYRYENVYGPGTFETRQFTPDSGEFFVVDSSLKENGLAVLRKWVKELEKGISREIVYDPSQLEMIDEINKKAGGLKALMGGQAMNIPMNQVWLQALVDEPKIVEIFLDVQLYWSMAQVKTLAGHGVDLILGGGDLASNHGPVYSPMTFKEVVAPRFKTLVDYCHKLGVPYIFRTDGDTRALWSSFREIGVDGLGEIDKQAGMDVGEIRNYFGKDFIIFGGVDCAKTLVFGSKEQISEEVKYAVEKAGAGGGLILSTSNCVHWNVPAQNYLWMIEAGRQYGKYEEKINHGDTEAQRDAQRKTDAARGEEEEKKEERAEQKAPAAAPAPLPQNAEVKKEDLKKKKRKITLEQIVTDVYLIGTLAVFWIGGMIGYFRKLAPVDWILRCAAVQLMLTVGAVVATTIIKTIKTPEEKRQLNPVSLLGLAFFLLYWIFYLTWDLELYPYMFVRFGKFMKISWFVSSIASLAFTSIGEIISREKSRNEGLGTWAVLIIIWFVIFYFLYYAMG